jgi:hypothetical protein
MKKIEKSSIRYKMEKKMGKHDDYKEEEKGNIKVNIQLERVKEKEEEDHMKDDEYVRFIQENIYLISPN